MESASKDILFTIAMNLDLPSLLRWCQSNSRINKYVCQNDDVWRNRLLRDYPDYLKFHLNKSLGETYVFLYQLSYIKKLLNTNKSLYEIFLKNGLDLSHKDLKKVPAFDLPNLQELSLSYNHLTEVPAFNLPNLRILMLSDNQLTKLPPFNLPNLQILFLFDNQLTEVPAFDLPNLRKLSLSYNYLTAVPAFDLPNLQILFLRNNQLTEVPAFNLPNLQELYLQNNQLTEVTKKELKQKYGNKVYL